MYGFYMSKHWIDAVFLCACVVGFTYQVGFLTALYLRHDTVTKTRMEITRFLNSPDLHVCPATHHVFDFERYNADFNTSLGNITLPREALAFQSMMTVAELLEYSHKADNLLDGCAVRRPQDNSVKYLDQNGCVNEFNITKYFVFEYICYVVDLKPIRDDLLYDTTIISYALNHPGLFFELSINPKWLPRVKNFKLLSTDRMNSDKSIPGANLIEIGQLENSPFFNRFVVSHYEIIYKSLPPPYTSMCRDYVAQGFTSARDCASACMNTRILEQLDRFWYAIPVSYLIDKHPVSAHDFENKTFGRRFERIYTDCQSICAQRDCAKTWTMTMVRSQRVATRRFTISVVTNNQPAFHVEEEAQLTFEAYLLFVMSCIGSWFGLSVLSFCPSRLIQVNQLKTRRQQLKVLIKPSL